MPASTSPEPAVASSGPPFVLMAARPSGAAITVSMPLNTTTPRASRAAARACSTFEAAAAAVWLHAACGASYGSGLTAERLVGALRPLAAC